LPEEPCFACANPFGHGVAGCLGREILCPTQEFVSARVAALVEAKDNAFADLERLLMEPETQMALHVFHERLHSLVQQLPGGFGRLSIAPRMAPRQILLDLATSSGEPGRWFAAAKDAGFLDLALEFANTGRTDPRTLSRASRDLLKKDAQFGLDVGRLAIQRIIEGYGYELTGMDVIDAYKHFMAAAQALGIASQARAELLAMATKQAGAASDILLRQCSVDPPAREAPGKAFIREQRTWTRRSPTRH